MCVLVDSFIFLPSRLPQRLLGQVRYKHWLDAAAKHVGEAFTHDVKTLSQVLVMFIPAPLFWALFDQQASRWTMQAEEMKMFDMVRHITKLSCQGGRVGYRVFHCDSFSIFEICDHILHTPAAHLVMTLCCTCMRLDSPSYNI